MQGMRHMKHIGIKEETWKKIVYWSKRYAVIRAFVFAWVAFSLFVYHVRKHVNWSWKSAVATVMAVSLLLSLFSRQGALLALAEQMDELTGAETEEPENRYLLGVNVMLSEDNVPVGYEISPEYEITVTNQGTAALSGLRANTAAYVLYWADADGQRHLISAAEPENADTPLPDGLEPGQSLVLYAVLPPAMESGTVSDVLTIGAAELTDEAQVLLAIEVTEAEEAPQQDETGEPGETQAEDGQNPAEPTDEEGSQPDESAAVQDEAPAEIPEQQEASVDLSDIFASDDEPEGVAFGGELDDEIANVIAQTVSENRLTVPQADPSELDGQPESEEEEELDLAEQIQVTGRNGGHYEGETFFAAKGASYEVTVSEKAAQVVTQLTVSWDEIVEKTVTPDGQTDSETDGKIEDTSPADTKGNDGSKADDANKNDHTAAADANNHEKSSETAEKATAGVISGSVSIDASQKKAEERTQTVTETVHEVKTVKVTEGTAQIEVPETVNGQMEISYADEAGEEISLLKEYVIAEQQAPDITYERTETDEEQGIHVVIADDGGISSGIGEYQCIVDGEEAEASEVSVLENAKLANGEQVSTALEFDVLLEEGTHQIVLSAKDQTGNEAYQEFNITIVSDEVISVVLPTSVGIAMMPYEIENQIFGDDIVVCNRSEFPVDVHVSKAEVVVDHTPVEASVYQLVLAEQKIGDEVYQLETLPKECDVILQLLTVDEDTQSFRLKEGIKDDIVDFSLDKANEKTDVDALFAVQDAGEVLSPDYAIVNLRGTLSPAAWQDGDLKVRLVFNFEKAKEKED